MISYMKSFFVFSVSLPFALRFKYIDDLYFIDWKKRSLFRIILIFVIVSSTLSHKLPIYSVETITGVELTLPYLYNVLKSIVFFVLYF